jgi:hypothetical protein
MLAEAASFAVESPYDRLAARLIADGILSDPWLDGAPRFRAEPVVLSAADRAALETAAEDVGAIYDQVVQLCAQQPELVAPFFGFTPSQWLMWSAAAPFWHGIARADVFFTDDGPQVCELNCDTPSGEAETVLLNAAAHAERPWLVDPNAQLEERFCRLVAGLLAALPGRDHRRPPTIGILYPTELPEDLSMITLYTRWLEARGARVVLGSPYNLHPVGERGVALFDEPCDLLIRHYKTDWWGERLPIRDDEEPYADPAPLVEPLGVLLRAALRGGCAVLNPFSSVLPQNKRAMALMWEEIDRFQPSTRAAIRRLVPETVRLERMPRERMLAERNDWVLKSDYGCEGAEVVIGNEVPEAAWAELLAHAHPSRWIAQRRFCPRLDEGRASVNHGVYLVAGRAAGIYSRLQQGATDRRALTAATLVEERP